MGFQKLPTRISVCTFCTTTSFYKFLEEMKIFWILLLLLVTAGSAFPLFSFQLSETASDVMEEKPVAIHHRHKHHRHHKHRRRSLSSKEDAKTRRNKQVMLTKPYWPWP